MPSRSKVVLLIDGRRFDGQVVTCFGVGEGCVSSHTDVKLDLPTLMLVAWSEDSTGTAPQFHIGSHFDIKVPDGATLRGWSACHA